MNEEDTNALLHPNLTDQGYVRLPVTPAQFKEFVSSLLGSEQSIGGSFECGFTCDPALIQDFVNLIEQRIVSQLTSSMLTCEARFSFSDRTYANITGFENILTYHNLNPVEVIRLDLLLIFLVRFNESETPKKQTIEVSFFSFYDKNKEYQRSKINYNIKSSNSTFSYDIQNIIQSFIHRKSIFKNSFLIFLEDFEPYIAFFIPAVVFFYFIFSFFIYLDDLSIKKLIQYRKEYNILGNLEDKIDFIFGKYTNNTYLLSIFEFKLRLHPLIPTLIFSFPFFFGFLLCDIYKTVRKSEAVLFVKPSLGFILFSDETQKYRDSILKKYKIGLWSKILVFVIFPIILGLVTNYIYDKLKTG